MSQLRISFQTSWKNWTQDNLSCVLKWVLLHISLCVLSAYPHRTQIPCSGRCVCSLQPGRAAPEQQPFFLLWTKALLLLNLPRRCQSPPHPEQGGYDPHGSLQVSITFQNHFQSTVQGWCVFQVGGLKKQQLLFELRERCPSGVFIWQNIFVPLLFTTFLFS